MKLLGALFITFLMLVPSLSLAQIANNQPIYQSGMVTPGHLGMFATSGVLQDAGAASGGPPGTTPNSLNITGPNTPFCINDAPTTSLSGYHQFCLGANALGGGLLSYNAYAGATPLALTCVVNNIQSPCFGSVSGIPVVANNTSLQNLPLTDGPTIYRAGFYVQGDGGGAVYNLSSSNCSIPGGDNGSQVQPTTGTGCWVVSKPPTGLSFMVWGSHGDGSTPDDAFVQAALTNSSPGDILLTGGKVYAISSGVTCNVANLTVVGTNGLGNFSYTATSGFKTTAANVTPITVGANCQSFTVRNVYFQMGTAPAQNTSGAAVAEPESNPPASLVLDHNTVSYACIGFDVGGNNIIIDKNLIEQVSGNSGCYGMRIGHYTAGTTIDPRITNNTIQSIQSLATNAAAGMRMEDSGGAYVENNDILYTIIGTDICPGANQGASGFYVNTVLGDTTSGEPLRIDTCSSTARVSLSFTQDWEATSASGATFGSVSGLPNVFIANTAGSTNFHTFSFTNSQNIGASGDSVMVDGTAGNVGLTLDSVKLCRAGFGNPSATTYNLELGVSVSGVVITGSTIGNCPGDTSTGHQSYSVAFDGSNQNIVMGNNALLGGSVGPVLGEPSYSTQTSTINNNVGLDSLFPNVAAAATMDAGVYQQININSGSPMTIETMNGCWPGRKNFGMSFSSASYTIGTSGNFQAALTPTPNLLYHFDCIGTSSPKWAQVQ